MLEYILHCVTTRSGDFVELGPYHFNGKPQLGKEVRVDGIYVGRMTVSDFEAECRKEGLIPRLYLDSTGLKENHTIAKEFEPVFVAEFKERIQSLLPKRHLSLVA